jgi:hypothetical protein
VSYETVIAPLANLEAEEFAGVQGCVFPSLVAVSKDVRNASTEAEKKIDAHNVKCRFVFYRTHIPFFLSAASNPSKKKSLDKSKI